MKRNPAQQYDANRQATFCPEEGSNEGHVYVALGISQQKIDTCIQRELKLAQLNGNYDTVAARNAAHTQRQ